MKDTTIGRIQKIYCNTCQVLTNHELVYVQNRELTRDILYEDQATEAEESEQWTYQLWVCRGCDTATLQEDYVSFAGNEPKDIESLFHPHRSRERLPIKVFKNLDEKLKPIYEEVILSFNNNALTLCTIGLRALLEGICADKEIQGKNLYQKIEGLTVYLPKNIVESLHQFRFAGNEAAHEFVTPERSNLQNAIEVLEDLLNFLYELDYKMTGIFAKTAADSTSVEKPDPTVIKQVIERHPIIPNGQRALYRALYAAGDKDLNIQQLAAEMGRTESQLFGVLGALGRRINNTTGVEGTPGVNYVFELVKDAGSKENPSWGWKMRPELREVLKAGHYDWL